MITTRAKGALAYVLAFGFAVIPGIATGAPASPPVEGTITSVNASTVPRTAEIFRLTQLRLADLRPGMRVVVRGAPAADGGLVATTITVEAPR